MKSFLARLQGLPVLIFTILCMLAPATAYANMAETALCKNVVLADMQLTEEGARRLQAGTLITYEGRSMPMTQHVWGTCAALTNDVPVVAHSAITATPPTPTLKKAPVHETAASRSTALEQLEFAKPVTPAIKVPAPVLHPSVAAPAVTTTSPAAKTAGPLPIYSMEDIVLGKNLPPTTDHPDTTIVTAPLPAATPKPATHRVVPTHPIQGHIRPWYLRAWDWATSSIWTGIAGATIALVTLAVIALCLIWTAALLWNTYVDWREARDAREEANRQQRRNVIIGASLGDAEDGEHFDDEELADDPHGPGPLSSAAIGHTVPAQDSGLTEPPWTREAHPA